MNGKIVIIGYGPVGRATADILSRRGVNLRIAQRKPPSDLPPGAEFAQCDVLDSRSVRAAVEGASQVVLSVGLAYDRKVWRDCWPRLMTNVVEACAAVEERLVFFDNLYMYGARDAPLKETNPLANAGVKTAARSIATRIWRTAHKAARLKAAAVRAPDFYGPGVGLSVFGDTGFGRLAADKPALFLGNPDLPHDFAYVPDCGRAVVSLLEAPDDDFGRPWHVPSAPTRTARELFALGAAALGVKPRITALPAWSFRPLGLFVPLLGEFADLHYNWDRPYRVDASDFCRRFWSDPTPFEVGAAETARWFARQRGGAKN